MIGYCATANNGIEIAPIKQMNSATTQAKIGLSMKKLGIRYDLKYDLKYDLEFYRCACVVGLVAGLASGISAEASASLQACGLTSSPATNF